MIEDSEILKSWNIIMQLFLGTYLLIIIVLYIVKRNLPTKRRDYWKIIHDTTNKYA